MKKNVSKFLIMVIIYLKHTRLHSTLAYDCIVTSYSDLDTDKKCTLLVQIVSVFSGNEAVGKMGVRTKSDCGNGNEWEIGNENTVLAQLWDSGGEDASNKRPGCGLRNEVGGRGRRL